MQEGVSERALTLPSFGPVENTLLWAVLAAAIIALLYGWGLRGRGVRRDPGDAGGGGRDPGGGASVPPSATAGDVPLHRPGHTGSLLPLPADLCREAYPFHRRGRGVPAGMLRLLRRGLRGDDLRGAGQRARGQRQPPPSSRGAGGR